MKSMERPKFKRAGAAASLLSVRETKRRRISRRRRAIHIPNDIVEEVLVRLPVISLTRFQTVSKDWRSLIRSRFQFRAFTRLGFGKDTVARRCKLVWLYNKYPRTSASTSSTICEVLDLEDKKWRFVSTAALDHHRILDGQRPVFANGSFYWLTGDEEGYPTTQTKLIVFDIHLEMFQVTETPPFVKRDACGDKIGVCNLDGRLCVSELKEDHKQEFWWRVKDQLWEKIFTVD